MEETPPQFNQARSASPDAPEEKAVVWGNTWPIGPEKTRVSVGDRSYEAKTIGKTVLEITAGSSNESPLFVAIVGEAHALRFGHIRRTRPIVLRFPRPVRIAPNAAMELYCDYPLKPALFHESKDGTEVKILDVPESKMKPTWYGKPYEGVLCDLHYASLGMVPGEVSWTQLSALLRCKIRNKSSLIQEVGILLIRPSQLDFFELQGKLCVNVLQVTLHSSVEANIDFDKDPSAEGARLIDARGGSDPPIPGLSMWKNLTSEAEMFQGY